ncbi:Protein of unknown function [Tistlia consotensis]|uniref:Phosphonate metabolism protein n=1 Tax=Tistlia consotensis USBA 355 TaxID=560819 RepID=A0A1Y6CNT8_9PROT|nr:DUF1045 domain-containing protein [Tistlia consotensis]SMF80501.1 Protein of unknown function [Tistlia consotensis USBA 355]SNR62831.1 Protein of unknown function [Tistlia consotensis]
MRFALYYTPPAGSPLGALGERWFAEPAVAELTAQARVYGFHATLKAPFRLAGGETEASLTAALRAFCAGRRPVVAGRLRLADLDGFLALVPERQNAATGQLAADCVTGFDGFRAPPGAGELAKRRAAGLSDRQESHLARWGYPYVLEEFRFHMTLTRRLAAAEAAAARARLEPLLAPVLSEPLLLDAVSLSRQPAAGATFEVRARLALAA